MSADSGRQTSRPLLVYLTYACVAGGAIEVRIELKYNGGIDCPLLLIKIPEKNPGKTNSYKNTQ